MITRRQREVLEKMRDGEEELVYERGEGWVGLEKVAPRTVFALLRLAAISLDPWSLCWGTGALHD